jgi:hypothetical protein
LVGRLLFQTGAFEIGTLGYIPEEAEDGDRNERRLPSSQKLTDLLECGETD